MNDHPIDDQGRGDGLYAAVEKDRWAGSHILRGEIPRVVQAESLPTAAQIYRDQILTIHGGAGVADVAYICIKNSSDTYTWKNITDPTPAGVIVMWSGTIATIPTGWAICDGNNGTPNLLAKFIKGVATAATNPGTTGGATTHTHADHSVNITSGNDNAGSQGVTVGGTGVAVHVHQHAVTGTLTHDTPNNEPPYYALAYIMKL